MTSIRPMPKAVLIHEVEYAEYTESDRYGKGYKDPVTLTNVLVQPTSNINRSNVVESVAYSSLMFYDCTNSKPQNIEFKKNSKITFNGKEMVINKINPIYTFDLHHIELELI